MKEHKPFERATQPVLAGPLNEVTKYITDLLSAIIADVDYVRPYPALESFTPQVRKPKGNLRTIVPVPPRDLDLAHWGHTGLGPRKTGTRFSAVS